MDVRRYLFEPLDGQVFTADITAVEPGILAGISLALARASELGLSIQAHLPEGSRLHPGACALTVRGNAEQIACAEENLLGCIGKPSGIATMAGRFAARADGRVRVVCGAWKKVAPEIRKQLREAIALGGAGMRLVDEPFVYLDKNFVRMFAGISAVVARARSMDGRIVVVQIRGETAPIDEEASLAYRAGARVLMVDTGVVNDLIEVVGGASLHGFRQQVKIAFAGGVTAERLEDVITAGADIVDVGRAIIDAPILDFRLDVQPCTARDTLSK